MLVVEISLSAGKELAPNSLSSLAHPLLMGCSAISAISAISAALREPFNAPQRWRAAGISERDDQVVLVDDYELEGGVAEAGAELGAFFASGARDVGGAEPG